MFSNLIYISLYLLSVLGLDLASAQANNSIPKYGNNGTNPLGLVFVYRKEWENPSNNQFGASLRIGSSNSTINQEWIVQFQFPDSNQVIAAANFVHRKEDDGQYTIRTRSKNQGIIINGKQIVQLAFNGSMANSKKNDPPKTILFSLFPSGIAAAQNNSTALNDVWQAQFDVFVDTTGNATPLTPSAQFLSLMKDVAPAVVTAKPVTASPMPNDDLNILFYIIFPCLAGAIVLVVIVALVFKYRRDRQERQARERLEKVLVG